MTTPLIHEELSRIIIGAGMRILNVLKPGLPERIYERALIIELRKHNLQLDQQSVFRVHYDNQLVGSLQPDLIVEQAVIVDSKVVTAVNDSHVAQMLGYLNITELDLGMILNFKYSRLEWKRIVHTRPADGSDRREGRRGTADDTDER